MDRIEELKKAKSSSDLFVPSVVMADGDILVGKIDRFTEGFSTEVDDDGNQQGAYPIIIIEVEEASIADKDSTKLAVPGALVSVHAFHKVLRSQMRKANVAPGDRIGLRRFADVPKGNRKYADWSVVSADPQSSTQSFGDRFAE